MKKIISKIVLSAIFILSYPGKMFANTPTVPTITAGTPLEPTLISLVDRILGWLVLPLGALAVVFYSTYFFLKKRKKKTKRGYLTLAIVCTVLLVLIFLAAMVINLISSNL